MYEHIISHRMKIFDIIYQCHCAMLFPLSDKVHVKGGVYRNHLLAERGESRERRLPSQRAIYMHAFRWISEASIAPAVVLLIERTCVAGCLRRIDTHVQLCINYWYAVPDNRADIDAIINNFLQGSDTTLPCVCAWLLLAAYKCQQLFWSRIRYYMYI